MLRNHNLAVVDRLAKKTLRSNRRRSLTMILAALLSAFMLFSVLTVGVTYFKMQRLQNIRLSGAEFDSIMYGLTNEQRKKCESNPDIQRTGICAVAGYVQETDQDSTPNVGLLWADPVYWNEMMEPARESVEGEYPTAADEVMVTKEALKECGLEGLRTGDSFTMTYETFKSKKTKTFRISGMWSGFGAKKVFFVSEDFYDQSGYMLSQVSSGRFYIDFKQKLMPVKEQESFISSMELGKQQRLFFTDDIGYSIRILSGIAGLLLITCVCAYLLIYNIMYLSVAGNIRYYGLLQTIGMTARQIYRLMYRQMLVIGGCGIAGGIVLGCAVSFFVIPVTVKTLGIHTGNIIITFHPVIFIVTILLTGLTVAAASWKPAKMAVSTAPIAALGYRKAARKKNRKTGRGNLIWRMAREQLIKDKKKSGIVILSLSLSLSVFLCMITLIKSQGAREFISNYMEMDLIVENDTIKKEEQEQRKQILSKELLADIGKAEGVKEVHPVIYTQITVPWEPDFSDIWMREFYEMWMSIPYEEEREEYKQFPENFGSSLVGIDDTELDYLNKTLEQPIDKAAFLEGKTCILYRNSLDFKDSELAGKEVSCAEYDNAQNRRTFQIAGLTDEQYYTALLGYPPTIIVSDRVVKEFVSDPLIFKASVRYLEEYDKLTEERIIALTQASPYSKDFSFESKIELMENVEKAQGNMIEVGIGIVFILALIGILNYMNTTMGSIQSRQVEISVMESIGMTEGQVKKMLILEGLLYAGGAFGLTLTAGLAVTYVVFQSMNYRGIPFEIPLLPIAAAAVCIVLICIIVPLTIFRNQRRSRSVIERIRGFE